MGVARCDDPIHDRSTVYAKRIFQMLLDFPLGVVVAKWKLILTETGKQTFS